MHLPSENHGIQDELKRQGFLRQSYVVLWAGPAAQCEGHGDELEAGIAEREV